MSLRQLGFALNVYDGPLSIFLTCNFADTYSPITATLMNGAVEPLGKRAVNLLDDCPRMPTLQAIHRTMAKHPPGCQRGSFCYWTSLCTESYCA